MIQDSRSRALYRHPISRERERISRKENEETKRERERERRHFTRCSTSLRVPPGVAIKAASDKEFKLAKGVEIADRPPSLGRKRGEARMTGAARSRARETG